MKLINDAAMQALGEFNHEGTSMLFLGTGTGLGTAMIAGGIIETDGTGPPALQEGHL